MHRHPPHLRAQRASRCRDGCACGQAQRDQGGRSAGRRDAHGPSGHARAAEGCARGSAATGGGGLDCLRRQCAAASRHRRGEIGIHCSHAHAGEGRSDGKGGPRGRNIRPGGDRASRIATWTMPVPWSRGEGARWWLPSTGRIRTSCYAWLPSSVQVMAASSPLIPLLRPLTPGMASSCPSAITAAPDVRARARSSAVPTVCASIISGWRCRVRAIFWPACRRRRGLALQGSDPEGSVEPARLRTCRAKRSVRSRRLRPQASWIIARENSAQLRRAPRAVEPRSSSRPPPKPRNRSRSAGSKSCACRFPTSTASCAARP